MTEENKIEETITAEQKEVTVTEDSTTSSEPQKGLHTVWIAVVFIIGAMCIGGLVFFMDTDSSAEGEDAVTLGHDAEYVLATVNGEAIYQKDIDTRVNESAQEFLAQGVDMTDLVVRTEIESQILEDMIGYKLLLQASTDVVVSEEEVDALLQGYVEQSGGEEALEAELAKVDLTPDLFRERIVEQLTLQQYISENVQEIAVSDEDVAAFYQSVAAGQEGVPPLDEVREQIEAQLVSNSQQQQVVAFVASLREAADVVVN